MDLEPRSRQWPSGGALHVTATLFTAAVDPYPVVHAVVSCGQLVDGPLLGESFRAVLVSSVASMAPKKRVPDAFTPLPEQSVRVDYSCNP